MIETHGLSAQGISVKKEGCEWPLCEAKAPERPLFSRVLSHKTMFFFYFPFMLPVSE